MTGAAPIVHDFTGHPALNLHLLAVHCNAAALGLSPEEAADQHHHEHSGPGGLRHHDFASLHWDAVKATEVINEAAQSGPGDNPNQDLVARLLTPYQPDAHPAPQFGWVHVLPVGEHTHTTDVPVTACPDGHTCAVFPRYVAAHSERNPDDRTPGTGLTRIDNAADLAADHLLIMQRELVFLEAILTDPKNPKPFEAALTIAAGEHLTALIALLHPMLYPEKD